MKRLPLYLGICLTLIIIALFLPYETHDTYSGGWLGPTVTEEIGIVTLGIEIWGPIILLILFIFISAIVLSKRYVATAVIGFVLSIPLLFFMGLGMLEFTLLNFEIIIFSNIRHSHILIGYYIALLAYISYTIILLINLIATVRLRKTMRKESDENSLLDNNLSDI